ncbi:hypothetical protein GTT58_004071 [Salmonella enterica]|nr:hypothetical protein [Salmonella enterica subsp. enterica serovar Infantis]EDT2380826.1 hypothetical protein [Salmonella enterica]ECN8255899.1 hypothetical protein [Salmonella enterica subsp. enterica serovar Infantis]ECR2634497.1 hypothetical protein [Salmonella enterica subsp. enterica serovar Infantis]ECV9228896.1 hypothetical protein [Salmonella enterica subsp. enterica serovar Infantis]
MNTSEATGVRIPEYVPARPDALAGQPDAGGELFLSRDRNENICTCTGHGLSAGSCGAGRADEPGVKLAGAE